MSSSWSWVVVLAGLAWSVPAGAEDAGSPPQSPQQSVQQSVLPEGAGQAEPGKVAGGGPQEGPLWIGVVCYPAPEALKAQLKIPHGQGLIVSDVAPGSPAAAAGIRRHDVLLRAGERDLGGVADLMEYVGRHGRQPVALQILRTGERMTVQVTPGVRPAEQRGAVFLPGADRQALREFMERLDPNIDLPLKRRRLRLRFLHPGLILESGPEGRPWPADLSVSITREGNQPTKITVRRGEQTWEIDREQLEKLPDMVRPFVEGMLAGSGSPPDNVIEMPFEVPPEVDLPDVQLPESGELPPPADEATGDKATGDEATGDKATGDEAAAAPPTQDRRTRLRTRLEAIEGQLKQLRDALEDEPAAGDTGP
ncbi:MAG: PDZ domain-containing protein [Planctomycetales bacterium]|nr:PDZ domain-containing protein [Planctomycetales bacterium]